VVSASTSTEAFFILNQTVKANGNVVDLPLLPSIAEVYEVIQGVPLDGERQGDEIIANCLMAGHPDANPSCHYNVVKDTYKCFSCEASGGVLGLVVGSGTVSARKDVAAWFSKVGLRKARKSTADIWLSVDVLYSYTDANGTPVYDVGRWNDPKRFGQRAYQPDGKFKTGVGCLDGVPRYPYKLVELLRGCESGTSTVYVVEGEKDADLLRSLGLVATTNAQGAAWTWPVDWASYFTGAARVVVLADNDEAGRKAATRRAALIARVAPDTRLIAAMPDVAEKGDVSDWFAAGGSLAGLERIAEAAPVVAAYVAPYPLDAVGRLVEHFTDSGNGRWFAETVGADYLWASDADKGQWLHYDGAGVWTTDANMEAATERAVALMRQACADYNGPADDDFADHVQRTESHRMMCAMLERAKAHLRVSPALFNRDGSMLPVANGTLDLRTSTLREHRREDYLTFKSPIAYDPDATCPTFERLLDEATASTVGVYRPHLREYLEMMLGGALEARTTQRRCFFLFGPKGTRKSTVIRTAQLVLSKYAIDISYNILSDATFESDGQGPTEGTMRLKNRRLVVASEAKPNQRLNVAGIKRMIGGDGLSGRHNHGAQQEFTFEGTLVMTGNELPRIVGDDSFWDKFKPIPFENQLLDAEDPEFEERELWPELPGILALLVRAHARLRAAGYKMIDTPEVTAIREDQREQQDTVAPFVRECIEEKKGGRVELAPMRKAYASYCKLMSIPALGERALANALAKKLPPKGKSHGNEYWKDVTLKSNAYGGDAF
jgi:putative DNA primase/helicase